MCHHSPHAGELLANTVARLKLLWWLVICASRLPPGLCLDRGSSPTMHLFQTDDVGQGGGCPKSQFLLGRL